MIKPPQSFWDDFKQTNGALSACEACFILECTSLAPEGNYIECGTAYGKSAMVASYKLASKGKFYLIDPLFENDDISLGVQSRVKKYFPGDFVLLASTSDQVIPLVDKYSYAMLDSGDHETTIMAEIELIKDRMVKDGIIVFHDLDSQFSKVREAFNILLNSGNYEEIKPDWKSIIEYVRENELEVNNQSWHHNELEFPCFIGALKRK